MGVIIDVLDHSLSAEKSRIANLQSNVDFAINAISSHLDALNTQWIDEKSVTMLSDLNTAMEEIKKANTDAKTATEEYLSAIGQILKMNYGG